MQYFLKAFIFCSVGFFNFLLSNFEFVSDDVNIPYFLGVLMDFTGRARLKAFVFLLFFRYCAGQRFIAALSHTGGQARKN